jgi:Ser/Thr protein kinase RdoA (MazF antagonist)
LKEWISRHYDFGEDVDLIFYCRGVSDTYLLSTATRQYALKVYRTNWRTRQAILDELAAIRHLGSRGVEVAMPVPRGDGEWITHIPAPEGPRNAMLFHWAAGRAPLYSNVEHARRYGDLVGRMHAASADLPLSAARPRLDADYLLEVPLTRIRTRLKRWPRIARDLDALAERTRARIAEVFPQLSDLGFCHGDIWANNARIDGERLVLFDFDLCGIGPTLFDLATYRWDARCKGFETVAWPAFLEGYLRIRPQAEASLQHLGLFMILRHLWTAAFFVGRLPETGAYFLSDDDLENLVPFCETLESHAP